MERMNRYIWSVRVCICVCVRARVGDMNGNGTGESRSLPWEKAAERSDKRRMNIDVLAPARLSRQRQIRPWNTEAVDQWQPPLMLTSLMLFIISAEFI